MPNRPPFPLDDVEAKSFATALASSSLPLTAEAYPGFVFTLARLARPRHLVKDEDSGELREVASW